MSGNRKIASVKELPDWFDLTKYAKANSLDAKGWFNQWVARQMMIPGVYFDEVAEIINYPQLKVEYKQWIKGHVTPIRQKGIVTLDETEELMQSRKNEEESSTLKNVRPATVCEIYWAAKRIEPEKTQYMDKFFWSEDAYTGALKRQDWFDEPYHSHYFGEYDVTPDSDVFLTVDLRCPDNLILSGVKNELLKIRQQLAVKKEKQQVNNVDFNRWVEFGILPYHDLTYWASENEVTIPHRVLAYAIFPDGSKGEETIRKTTKPLTEEFFEMNTLSALKDIMESPAR